MWLSRSMWSLQGLLVRVDAACRHGAMHMHLLLRRLLILSPVKLPHPRTSLTHARPHATTVPGLCRSLRFRCPPARTAQPLTVWCFQACSDTPWQGRPPAVDRVAGPPHLPHSLPQPPGKTGLDLKHSSIPAGLADEVSESASGPSFRFLFTAASADPATCSMSARHTIVSRCTSTKGLCTIP